MAHLVLFASKKEQEPTINMESGMTNGRYGVDLLMQQTLMVRTIRNDNCSNGSQLPFATQQVTRTNVSTTSQLRRTTLQYMDTAPHVKFPIVS